MGSRQVEVLVRQYVVFNYTGTWHRAKNQHHKGVEIDDTDIKPKLPIQANLGESEYTKIKKHLAPRVGSQENQ